MVKTPEGWIETTLKEIIDTIIDNRGKNPDYYVECGIPVIDNVLIKDNRQINLNEAKRFIDDYIYNNFIRKYNQPGDVIMTLVGNGYGNISLFPNKKSVIIQNTIGLRTNHQSINLFVYYLLKYKKREILELDIGAAQPSIKVGDLLSINITLPPLPEQKAIAGVLSSFDDKIELLRAENQTLEEMGQTLFKERFGKYKVGDELPDGWRVGKQKDVIDLLNGFAYKSSDFVEGGKYKLVTIANVQDGNFVRETKDSLDDIPDKMPEYCNLKTGDILLSLTGNVGRVCLVVGENYFLNQRVAKISPKNEKDYGYSYFYFRQNHMITLLESISVGTAQQNLSPIKASELELIIPSRESLDKFSEIANKIFNKIIANLEEINSLSETRDQLLPKLMSGEVRVEF